MAVKRRTIWLNDEDWVLIGQQSVRLGVSNSVYLRDLVVGSMLIPAPGPYPHIPDPHVPFRTVEASMRAFRPVPKPGRK